MTERARSRKPDPATVPRGNMKTTRQQWLDAGRTLLIRGGAAGVKIDRLARDLNVTRGGFYWHFKNRQHFLDTLLEDWMRPDRDPLTHRLGRLHDQEDDDGDELAPFLRVILTLIRERSYDPALDSAMRDWAKSSAKVRAAVREVDDRRIRALTRAFQTAGYEGEEAFIRARIFYFHQVGYYAIHVDETTEQRLRFAPVYMSILVGKKLKKKHLATLEKELSRTVEAG